MSLMDALKQSGILDELGQMARENPDLARAAHSLFSTSDTSIGGGGGLAGILRALESSGLADAVASWLGSGGNHAVSPGQLRQAMGDEAVSEFSKKAGLGVSAALSLLAGLLPQLVHSLTPKPDAAIRRAGSATGTVTSRLRQSGRRGESRRPC